MFFVAIFPAAFAYAMLPNLLAFGFGNLLIFWWLAAAGLPIVIHLWNKRKYREVPWAAVEYLLAALRKNARRIQLEQWLLLAIRTSIILLVVCAMAEPFLESAGMSFSAGQRTHRLIVIDGSYSMGYKPTDKTRFERAKQRAVQIVEESPQGDGFTLILLANPPVVIVGSPAIEPRDFLEEIDNLKMTHGGADLAATLAKVEEVLRGGDAGRTDAERGLFSDRSGAQYLDARAGQPGGRSRVPRPAGAVGRPGGAGRARLGAE